MEKLEGILNILKLVLIDSTPTQCTEGGYELIKDDTRFWDHKSTYKRSIEAKELGLCDDDKDFIADKWIRLDLTYHQNS